MKSEFEPDISTGQLCFDYYEYELFNTHEEFEIAVYFEILKADASAKMIASDILIRELLAVNVELFGLAWGDHNYRLCVEGKLEDSQATKLMLTEIWFTKSYLERLGESDIWIAMGFYNEIVLQAAIVHETLMDWSIPRDIPSYYERGIHSSADKMKKEELEHYLENFTKILDDKECCIRLANRFISFDCWRDGIMIPQKLSSAFAQRLGFNPNLEALLLLQRVIVGLYDNAGNFINAVEEYGSWESARKAADDLREHIIKSIQKDIEKRNRSDEPGMR